MKFNNIYFCNIRVKELADFLHVVFPFLNVLGVLNVKLKELLVGLALQMKELDEALPKVSFKGETRTVNDYDDHRDSEYLAFRTFIEAFIHSRNPTTREQAMLIYDTLKANGYALNNLPMKAESTSIRALDELFKVGRCADSLQALSAKPLWGNVMIAQDEFEGVNANRSELRVTEDTGEAAFIVAKRVKAKCTEVFEMVEALYLVEGKAEYANAIVKINQEIDAVMVQIRTRATLAAKAKDTDKQPNLPNFDNMV